MIRRFDVFRNSALCCGLVLAVMVPLDVVRATSNFTVLYSFDSNGGSDGGDPYDGLIADAAGNLYGTTIGGGGSDYGTVFKLASDGTETVLHAFAGGSEGGDPQAALIADNAGNLYGTTPIGGDLSACNGVGCGTVFKLAQDGTQTVFHAFEPKEGTSLDASLIVDKKGNLYGTAPTGGNLSDCSGSGCGTVFRLAPDGNLKVLHTFTGGSDGAAPDAGLLARNGNFYGTAASGGANDFGTVFELAPDGTLNVLYAFKGGNDGSNPTGALIADRAGNLYGTTFQGGSTGCSGNGLIGCGTVFKLAPDGTEIVLHAFKGGSDGQEPIAGLVAGNSGELFGTTFYGGSLHDNCGGGSGGCGTIFKVAADGTESVLHPFEGRKRGRLPRGGLILVHGYLYGTTVIGGTGLGCSNSGCGTIFRIKG